MKIEVNGKDTELDIHTLDQLVKHYNLKEEHVVAEVDGEIVDRTGWKAYELKPGAKIELVHFVGGG
jgi:thiamine-phosphate pyrophosphorylase